MDPQKDNNTQPKSDKALTDLDKVADHISFFEKDDYFAFVYKKTEKLTTAVYMVTSLFSDSEPMKWTLRKKSSELLSFILGYKNQISGQNFFLGSVKEQVLDIVSLLDVSSKSGLVSTMNFSILRGEFLNLVKILGESKFSGESLPGASLPESFFEISRSLPLATSGVRQADSPNLSDTNLKDRISENNNQIVLKRTNRQSIIIGLLKKKKEMDIKAIAQTIRDCSEKTIQRELISLIRSGIVKKTGERRWSKYSLFN
jgi:hypothetical protein